jgi:uncharacterized protein (TIGR03435 family)
MDAMSGRPRITRVKGSYASGGNVRAAILAALLSGIAFTGQSKGEQTSVPLPEFEVASVKPSNPDIFDVSDHVPDLNVEPGRVLNIANITLKDILMLAHKAGAAQISGPSWILNRFDIVAKIPVGAAKEQIPLMLQALLADRFKLTLHREQKDIPVYALTVSSRGQKLQPSAVNHSGNAGCTRSYAENAGAKSTGATFVAACHEVSSTGLAQAIQTMSPNYFDRPVVDVTGLTGVYDFTLEWISFGEWMSGATGPTIFEAIGQLGLNLEKRKQPMEIFVIDHCEKEPTAN